MAFLGLNRLGVRSKKPRLQGLTMLMDPGVGIQAFQDCLELAADYIDFIKLGFGTCSLTPPHILRKKLALAKEYQVSLFPGGTFFECFAVGGREEEYFEQLTTFGFEWVEISNGTISLDRQQRDEAIQTAKSMGLHVITEIGKKREGMTIPVRQLINMFRADVIKGASYVIIEGRESGENIGPFMKAGELNTEYVEAIHQTIPSQKLIWEAPKKSQQIQFIKMIGNTVNLGNISFRDILSLESLRRGLRSDTFYHRVE